jgi:excinuclease ABC subunit A
VITVAMDLLPDVTVGCDSCQGERFGPAVLECRLEGRTIAEVLDATVDAAAAALAGDLRLAVPLGALGDIGLGYLRLGQETASLSAGEWQRLRLAGLLAAPLRGTAAVLLDEPTSGLGFEDVDRLVIALRRLAAAGHLVVVVEHDLDLVAASDWVIELGPGGGEAGGRVVVEGPPEAVMAHAGSATGQALRER